jgi:hypothetical protein
MRIPSPVQIFSVLAVSLAAQHALAGPFSVTNANIVGGVYDFHYYSIGDKAVINGVTTPAPALTLTNTGWDKFGSDPGVSYWQASGAFSATQLAGALTMGWDFSAVTSPIAKIELKTRNFLFQFSPFTAHALGDSIFADLATPAAFGAGTYTNLYTFTGDGTTTTIGSGSVFEITPLLSSGWLANPNLLELKFGYQQHAIDAAHPNIPGKHLQVFRDNTGTGDDGFVLRATLVPEPHNLSLLAIGGLAIAVASWAARQRRRVAA